MKCPHEVTETVLEIIQHAVLSIRLAGYRKNADYCALEADHIHNLPGLILAYRKDKLEYYLNIERHCYVEGLKEIPDANPLAFEAQWQKLEKFLLTDAA